MKLKVSPDNVIYGNDKSLLEELDTGRDVKFIANLRFVVHKVTMGIFLDDCTNQRFVQKPLIINECLFPDDEQPDHSFVEPPPEINDESIP